MRGLARDRDERFATAREMAVALERAVPPATAREIGEWVEATARVELDQRAAIGAAIEARASGATRAGASGATREGASGATGEGGAGRAGDCDEGERTSQLPTEVEANALAADAPRARRS